MKRFDSNGAIKVMADIDGKNVFSRYDSFSSFEQCKSTVREALKGKYNRGTMVYVTAHQKSSDTYKTATIKLV